MNGKAHAVIGVISAVALGLDPLMGAVGALLPDCDIKHAPAGKFLPLWLFGVKHRSRITHSWIPVALLTIITVSAGWNWGLVIGYISHLLADSITPMGLPIWGNDKKRYRFLFFKCYHKRT